MAFEWFVVRLSSDVDFGLMKRRGEERRGKEKKGKKGKKGEEKKIGEGERGKEKKGEEREETGRENCRQIIGKVLHRWPEECLAVLSYSGRS